MAIMLVVMGILTYYVAPTSFLFGQYELFFIILNCVLLMMILGLTFIAILILPGLQKLILRAFLLCFWKDRKLRQIIEKNMVSHQSRNTKTAIMFAICLSFLIFAGSTFKLIGNLIVSQLENSVGADFYATTIDYRSMNTFIDDGPISQFLHEQKQTDGAVESWTYASNSLKYIFAKIKPEDKENTLFSDMCGYKELNTNIHSIQENYLSVVNLKYYLPNEIEKELLDEYQKNGEEVPKTSTGFVDVVSAIYSNKSLNEQVFNDKDPHKLQVMNWPDDIPSTYLKEIKVVLPEGFRDVISLDTTRPARICIG